MPSRITPSSKHHLINSLINNHYIYTPSPIHTLRQQLRITFRLSQEPNCNSLTTRLWNPISRVYGFTEPSPHRSLGRAADVRYTASLGSRPDAEFYDSPGGDSKSHRVAATRWIWVFPEREVYEFLLLVERGSMVFWRKGWRRVGGIDRRLRIAKNWVVFKCTLSKI